MSSLAKLLRFADNLLRGESTHPSAWPERRHSQLGFLILAIVVFGMFYGAMMGSFGGPDGWRLRQAVYSAIKVPFLLITTFLLSLPSFFVINTLFGLRDDFARVVRALISTQAGLTIILSALAPFTVFWYISGSEYEPAILFNGMMFAVASFSAQWMLRRDYAAFDCRESQTSNHAAHLDRHLRHRRHSDGLGSPAVHRQSQCARAILPHRELEQRL